MAMFPVCFQDSKYEGRSGLARELNLHDTDGAPKGPLLMEMLKRSSSDRGNIGRPIGVEVNISRAFLDEGRALTFKPLF